MGYIHTKFENSNLKNNSRNAESPIWGYYMHI